MRGRCECCGQKVYTLEEQASREIRRREAARVVVVTLLLAIGMLIGYGLR